MFGRRRKPPPPVSVTPTRPEPVPAGEALRPWIVEQVAARGVSLGPPLTERDVQAFEVIHGIELPEAYRWFLTTVGNGGNGPPAYGLAPLNDARDDRGEPNPDIGRPQPLAEPWLWEDDPEAPDDLIEAAWAHGRLWLGTDGCGGHWALVVAGECRGEVFFVCGEGAGPAEARQDFLEWYADWLAKR